MVEIDNVIVDNENHSWLIVVTAEKGFFRKRVAQILLQIDCPQWLAHETAIVLIGHYKRAGFKNIVDTVQQCT